MLYRDVTSNLRRDENLNFIDFACGHGQLLHDLKFQNYIGVDIDEIEISTLQRKFPNRKFYNEDILFFKSPLKADLACCVETFGFNNKFNQNKIIETLNNVLDNLNDNGSFFLNIHYDLFKKNEENLKPFFKNFKKVQIKRYGFFINKCSKFLHKFLFQLEKLISINPNNGKYLYIKCENYAPGFSIK